MNRRGFLAGLMATAAAGVVARSLPVYVLHTTVAAGEVYGRSPAMMALPLLQREVATIIYGSPDVLPMQFCGFAMFVDHAA